MICHAEIILLSSTTKFSFLRGIRCTLMYIVQFLVCNFLFFVLRILQEHYMWKLLILCSCSFDWVNILLFYSRVLKTQTQQTADFIQTLVEVCKSVWKISNGLCLTRCLSQGRQSLKHLQCSCIILIVKRLSLHWLRTCFVGSIILNNLKNLKTISELSYFILK